MSDEELIVEDNPSDDLAAAWDAVETEEASDEAIQPAEPDTDPTAAAGTDVADEAPDQAAAEDDGGPAEGQGEGSAEEADSAPVSLPPAAREAWKDTPAAMREAIAKRERDYEQGIMKYADQAKRAQAMDQALRPYEHYFAMNGGKPAQQIGNLLQTASVLQGGAPQQKAQMVAQLIQQFGVDVRTLDNMLVGRDAPPDVQQASEIQQAVQQAVAPYQQHMSALQAQQQAAYQQKEQQTAQEIQNFANDPKNEFYKDVMSEMADVLEMASKRGVEMSLADAYQRAIAMRPDITQIIQARGQQQAVAQKQRAAVSVSGTLGGVGGQTAPDSLRSAIEDAWENAGRV